MALTAEPTSVEVTSLVLFDEPATPPNRSTNLEHIP
jgi:hypothetical protein